ncbi:MAG: hypothetical protein ACU85U_16135 [Gammaproteobacteria bacterium]
MGFALEHGRQRGWAWDCTTDAFNHYGHAGDPPSSGDTARAIRTGDELIAYAHPDDRERIIATLTEYLRGNTGDYEVDQ